MAVDLRMVGFEAKYSFYCERAALVAKKRLMVKLPDSVLR
jgi:hypothetical protein